MIRRTEEAGEDLTMEMHEEMEQWKFRNSHSFEKIKAVRESNFFIDEAKCREWEMNWEILIGRWKETKQVLTPREKRQFSSGLEWTNPRCRGGEKSLPTGNGGIGFNIILLAWQPWQNWKGVETHLVHWSSRLT